MRDIKRRLTVKLRGRAPTPSRRRGRPLFSSARGAKQEAHHGPLQRLLGDAVVSAVAGHAIAYPQQPPRYPIARGLAENGDSAPRQRMCPVEPALLRLGPPRPRGFYRE